MEEILSSGRPYNKLISSEEKNEDEHHLQSNQENQVTLSTFRPESSMNLYKVLTAGLATLAVILLVINIGLGVYYNKLTENNIVRDISGEITKLQASYDAAVQSRDEARKQLAMEISEQQVTKWELEHQSLRVKDYEKQVEKMKIDIVTLKSHIPMLKEGCRHCMSGWTFLSSSCFYFPFSDTSYRTSWNEARQFCRRQGGDLAIINSREKNLGITRLIATTQDPSRPMSQSGFWIGLTDVEEEGNWKWLDGTRLTEGFWNVDEPNNNQNNEDCAAVYPKSNPFLSWNDAPCNFNLKWICEMAPRYF